MRMRYGADHKLSDILIWGGSWGKLYAMARVATLLMDRGYKVPPKTWRVQILMLNFSICAIMLHGMIDYFELKPN